MMAMLAACDPAMTGGGSIKNPENYPDSMVKLMVDIYLANNADDTCSNIQIDEDARDGKFNKVALMASANNVDPDAFIAHWQSDDTTSKEDTYFLTFYNKHNISFDVNKHDAQFCAAMVQENAANTAIGEMINIR